MDVAITVLKESNKVITRINRALDAYDCVERVVVYTNDEAMKAASELLDKRCMVVIRRNMDTSLEVLGVVDV